MAKRRAADKLPFAAGDVWTDSATIGEVLDFLRIDRGSRIDERLLKSVSLQFSRRGVDLWVSHGPIKAGTLKTRVWMKNADARAVARDKPPSEERKARKRKVASEAGAKPSRGMRAFSIRQPWAEFIITGEKKYENRTWRTNIRERVYVYAGLGRVPEDVQMECTDYGVKFNAARFSALPRGQIVGTVEIVDCQEDDEVGYKWSLVLPERAKRLLVPKNHPQPGFFYPF